MFQTELVCGIICNILVGYTANEVKRFQTELVCGIICNAYSKKESADFSVMFQTELVCGIICN